MRIRKAGESLARHPAWLTSILSARRMFFFDVDRSENCFTPTSLGCHGRLNHPEIVRLSLLPHLNGLEFAKTPAE